MKKTTNKIVTAITVVTSTCLLLCVLACIGAFVYGGPPCVPASECNNNCTGWLNCSEPDNPCLTSMENCSGCGCANASQGGGVYCECR